MTDLDALLAGIVANPHQPVRWLIVADWLDDHGFTDRAELLRLHRMLIDTCCEPDAHPERAAWQARIVELIDRGVTPCVPQHTLMLPGGVPLVGNFIPPGSFLMGSEDAEMARPVHKVTVSAGYFVGVYAVTQTQWKAVTGGTPSRFKGKRKPVERVSWDDAAACCAQLTKVSGHHVRFPTDEEWEYACRAGTTSRFHYGDVPSSARMNFVGIDMIGGTRKTTEVGTFAANPWGLFDCHGNVTEWCNYDELTRWGRYRAWRGGSWGHESRWCESGSGNGSPQTLRHYTSGFRVAFTLS